jgi:hypothetical protein
MAAREYSNILIRIMRTNLSSTFLPGHPCCSLMQYLVMGQSSPCSGTVTTSCEECLQESSEVLCSLERCLKEHHRAARLELDRAMARLRGQRDMVFRELGLQGLVCYSPNNFATVVQECRASFTHSAVLPYCVERVTISEIETI